MKRKTVLAAGLVAVLAAVASVPVLAHGTGNGTGWGGMNWGPGAMMHNDGDGPHGGYGPMGRGYGQGRPGGGYGPMGGQGMMGDGMGPGMMGPAMMNGGPGGMASFMQGFDANSDGTVSPDELRSGLQGELKKYDANGDGTLSLDEFANLYAALTRTATVRHFQALDVNGDGQVTADEITAPADHMEAMQSARQLHQGGAGMPQGGPGPMMRNGNN